MRKLFYPLGFLILSASLTAQSINEVDPELINWYNKDLGEDDILGASVDKAYEQLLKDKKSKKTIVVAVMDSGTDIDHEDLKDKIWINKKEIEGNGVDDDDNGYVDDIYGWNFLGNKEGENIRYETYEITRVYNKLREKYANTDTNKLSETEKKEYHSYIFAKAEYEAELRKRTSIKEQLRKFENSVSMARQALFEDTGAEVSSVADLKRTRPLTGKGQWAKSYLMQLYGIGYSDEELEKDIEHNNKFLNKHLNVAYNPRAIIGDDPNDINDTDYGNGDVEGPRADHGTPVAGIIAAIRGNDIGIDGIAEDVKIMVLRTTPEGDERDKDVALGIRYAADNGAHIINMSFGKQMSPQKWMIDEAIQYALGKGVLFIHSAGNSGQNIDAIPSYPSDDFENGDPIPAWLNVGSNRGECDKYMLSAFSNYGAKHVDIFAPGERVVSLAPDNGYTVLDGTSFSGPVVTGVAALVWSYYPELTAEELAGLILEHSYKIEKPKKVKIPNLEDKRKKSKFKMLCTSGGVVNVYNILLALENKEEVQ